MTGTSLNPRVTVHALGTASRIARGVTRHPNTRIDPSYRHPELPSMHMALPRKMPAPTGFPEQALKEPTLLSSDIRLVLTQGVDGVCRIFNRELEEGGLTVRTTHKLS